MRQLETPKAVQVAPVTHQQEMLRMQRQPNGSWRIDMELVSGRMRDGRFETEKSVPPEFYCAEGVTLSEAMSGDQLVDFVVAKHKEREALLEAMAQERARLALEESRLRRPNT